MQPPVARRCALGALLVLSSISVPLAGRARAAVAGDENAAIGKITLLNRQAIEEYRKLNFDEAQRLLDQALDLAAGAGLTQHPIRARTYVTLGVVTAGGLKRRDVAVRLFRKALQIQPEIELSTELASPDVQVAFDEAVHSLGNEPKVERLASEMLVHEPVTKGNRGEAITIAVTPDDALHADRLVLAYRPSGAATFSKARMQKQSDGVFEGIIPGPATGGADIAYYVEARDLDDKLVAGRGSPVAPLMIALVDGPRGSAAPRAAEAPAGVATSATSASTTAGSNAAHAGEQARWVLALLVGSGGGWSKGSGEATGYSIGTSKLGWSKLGHVAPQIGYLVTPQLLISAWGRFQLVRGADAYDTPSGSSQCGGDGSCAAARGAFAGGVGAAWLFGGRARAFRPYVSLAAGAGFARQVVRINAANADCGRDGQQPTCLDTAAVGPFLGGPGIGVHLRLSSVTRLVFAVQSLFGAPRFTVDLDAALGIALVL
jgi:Tetratricopeptide repeat